MANIGIGVAITGGVLALGWFLLGPREKSERPTTGWTLTPNAGYRSGGATLEYTF